MYTRVYGTVFNVLAYDEDDRSEVVLVEGSVGVGGNYDQLTKNVQMLKPSQKASNIIGEDAGFLIEDVDVSPYISWTKGILAFENELMEDIIKRLQRQYDIRIENHYSELSNKRFTGMFDEESIDRVLRTIQAHTEFSYEIENDLIIIKNPNKQ